MMFSGIEFKSRKEAEAYFRELAVDAFKTAVKVWEKHGTMEASVYLNQKAEVLVKQYGFTWEQIEEMGG